MGGVTLELFRPVHTDVFFGTGDENAHHQAPEAPAVMNHLAREYITFVTFVSFSLF